MLLNNINLDVRKKYYSLLGGMTLQWSLDGTLLAFNGELLTVGGDAIQLDDAVTETLTIPIYYLNVPQGYPNYYVVIQSMESGSNTMSKCGDETQSIVTLNITTIEHFNGAEILHMISEEVLSRLSNTKTLGMMELMGDMEAGKTDPRTGMQVAERTIVIKNILQQ